MGCPARQASNCVEQLSTASSERMMLPAPESTDWHRASMWGNTAQSTEAAASTRAMAIPSVGVSGRISTRASTPLKADCLEGSACTRRLLQQGATGSHVSRHAGENAVEIAQRLADD